MITFHDFVAAFQKLGLKHTTPVIVHASLSAFGDVQGGAETVLGALIYIFDTLLMPGFTYKTMITPQIGPLDNGLDYSQSQPANQMAQFYRPNMPVDRLMGVVSEALRQHPRSRRSLHPILSFVGLNAGSCLESQTLDEPLKPLERLVEAKGWVLLLGVDHTVNTSLHYAERLAGRKQFVRWALTPDGVLECPRFPGCSDGFEQLAPRLEPITRQMQVGVGLVQALPLEQLVAVARAWIEIDPQALLCDRSYCERCAVVRKSASTGQGLENYKQIEDSVDNDFSGGRK
jgi:aminoglycoside 3-N-acetyltransferase